MARKSTAIITVAGNLGKDAEGRYTPAGKLVTETSLPVNQWDESTDWWKLVMWGERWQNLTQYLTKGKKVIVSGRPVIQKWTDSDGNERLTPTIEVTELELMGSNQTEGEPVPF